MTNIFLYIILIIGFPIALAAQVTVNPFEKQIIEHFRKNTWPKDSIDRDNLLPKSYDKDYRVSISNNPIEFKLNHFVLRNPYFSPRFDNAEKELDNIKNFPKSYSVIFSNDLVSLFENGKFACYGLDSFERDFALEKKIKY